MNEEQASNQEPEKVQVEPTPEVTKVEETVAEATETVAETEAVAEAKVEEAEAVAETVTEPEAVAETTVKADEPAAAEESKSNADIEELEDDEAEHFDSEAIEVDKFGKKDFVDLAEKMLDAIKKPTAKNTDVKNVDSVYKDIRAAYNEIHSKEVAEAKKAYLSENESEDGFAFKNDNYDLRFESLMVQIRDERKAFYNRLDALRENYFERKTSLLQQLREVVETEEKGSSRENWEAFKTVQNAWRDAGNVNSPHNGELWSAYNALLDRYFDIRSIQNELKDLDRKKNLVIREGYVVKIEEIAADLADKEMTNSILKKANEYLNEYKHTGPGPRKEQDALWTRMKAAFDIIYAKKRGQNEENMVLMEEVFAAKSLLVEKIRPFATFESDRINEWNSKTKELQEIQNQWNSLKGPMPKAKAKDISKLFWKLLKDFFKAKSAFFNKLDAERKVNLKAKEGLCEQVEAFVAAGDCSADNTNKVIALQREWKDHGHVPHKFRDSIYTRFKKAGDAFFDLKRDANKEQNKEYEDNLKAKEELCDLIEGEVKEAKTDLSKLPEYKKQYNAIGFVPRKDMNKIERRFVEAVNKYIMSSTGLDKDEKDKMMLKNEVEVTMKTGGNPRAMMRQENDLSRKLKSFEDEINQLNTNIEFFGRSKGADKIKAEYQKKIDKAQIEAGKIKEKLKMIRSAVS